jgi:ribosomal protein S12 methylthiotransferase accessory factor YcaO
MIARHGAQRVVSEAYGSTQIQAFTAALSEWIERWALNRSKSRLRLPSSNGIASGLLFSNAVERAKCESLERDAFLWHFRNQVPLVDAVTHSKFQDETIVLGQLQSADPNRPAFLATTNSVATGTFPCVIFGMGCALDPQIARQRAIEELLPQLSAHIEESNHCARPRYSEAKSGPFFHHFESRNSEVRVRFANLFRTGRPPIRKPLNSGLWRIQRLSPELRFFKVAHATHPDLIPLEFGKPEPDSKERPFYHPIF